MYQQTEQRDAGRAGADYATLGHTSTPMRTHTAARTQYRAATELLHIRFVLL